LVEVTTRGRKGVFMAVLAQCPVCKTRLSVKKKVCKKCGTDMDKAKAAK